MNPAHPPDVLLELVLPGKGLGALCARVRLLSGVDGGVALGLLLGAEAAAALAALEGAHEERVAVGPLAVLDLRRRALKGHYYHAYIHSWSRRGPSINYVYSKRGGEARKRTISPRTYCTPLPYFMYAHCEKTH